MLPKNRITGRRHFGMGRSCQTVVSSEIQLLRGFTEATDFMHLFYDPCPDCDVDDWNVCVYERKRAGRKSRETQPVSKSDDQSLHCGGLYRGNSDGERDQPSDFLENTISGISSCNTPLSMMLVGMMLAEMNPKGLLTKSVAFYTFVRLIVVPGIVFGLTALLPIDPLLRGITVIIAAMPTPITAVLLSGKHGGDEQCAAGMLFVSTLLSLVTLPIWCMFL